jgi:hypothetical protein
MVQKQERVAELSPERIEVLVALADQVTAGRAVMKWFKALGVSLTAIVTLGWIVLQILVILGWWRH